MSGVEVYKDDAGEWRWRIKSPNNRILADSAEGYKSKGGAANGLAAAIEILKVEPVNRWKYRAQGAVFTACIMAVALIAGILTAIDVICG
jgi:uncharacterized protein YegP (UPF0339 family)